MIIETAILCVTAITLASLRFVRRQDAEIAREKEKERRKAARKDDPPTRFASLADDTLVRRRAWLMVLRNEEMRQHDYASSTKDRDVYLNRIRKHEDELAEIDMELEQRG